MEVLAPALFIIVVVLLVRSRARRFLAGRDGLSRMSGRAVAAARRVRQKQRNDRRARELEGWTVDPLELKIDEESRAGEVNVLEELRAVEERGASSEPPDLPEPVLVEIDPPLVEIDPPLAEIEPPLVEPVAVAPVVESSDPADLAGDLFDGSAGFEAAERFDSQARGERVRWEGVVERVRQVQGPMGGSPSVQLAAVVPSSRSAPGRDVRWTCLLSAGDARVLGESVGRRVEIEATLDACDPYMWSFTLVDGRLLP